jgi:hypothetical protein
MQERHMDCSAPMNDQILRQKPCLDELKEASRRNWCRYLKCEIWWFGQECLSILWRHQQQVWRLSSRRAVLGWVAGRIGTHSDSNRKKLIHITNTHWLWDGIFYSKFSGSVLSLPFALGQARHQVGIRAIKMILIRGTYSYHVEIYWIYLLKLVPLDDGENREVTSPQHNGAD